MSGTFSSRTYNFNTLLGRSSFPDYSVKKVVVPRFQRGYSWKKVHVATFWEDVIAFHSRTDKLLDSQTYFLGPIVILIDQSLRSVDFAAASAKECESYTDILNIGDSVPKASRPFIDALMNKLSSERALPVLLSGLRCLKENDFERLSRSVVALVVRHSLIANLNPADLEATLYDTAREIRKLHKKRKRSPEIVNKARALLQKINPTTHQIREGIAELYLDKPTAQYLLREIADKMQSKSKGVTSGRTSIEHIFPRNAAKADWPNAAHLEPYVWHIGNLTLLEPKQNKDVGNKGFADKSNKYPQSELQMTKQVAEKFRAWDEKAITTRAQNMVSYIDQIWTV
jgi:hypothetical protein